MTADAFKDIEKLEIDLWSAADNLRANSKLTSSDYFMPVLGVIFLRHAANRFADATRQIEADQAAGRMPKRKLLPADFIRRRALFLPEPARYDWIMAHAGVEGRDLPRLVNEAMTAIEESFEPLKGVLPKNYGIFEPKVLEDLMRLFDSERIRGATGDVFGRIYEYFLAEFSIQKAHDHGAVFDPGDDHAEGLTVDLSRIDFQKLRDEFAKAPRKATAIRDLIEEKLQQMLARNPLRMDFQRKYQEIVADYNREKDRVTVEATFAALLDLVRSLDEEERRAVMEGLSEEELALFDLLQREDVGKAERERLEQASRSLLSRLQELLASMPAWTRNAATQADVKVAILDTLWETLPQPPFTEGDIERRSDRIYDHVWQQGAAAGVGLAR